MAEFIAYLCNDHNLTSTLFREIQLDDTAKTIRSAIGWIQDGRTLRRDNPKPTQPTNLTRIMSDIPSRAVIGYQTDESTELQPLRFRRLVFAHDGEFSELIGDKLSDPIPTFLREAIQSNSDSSIVFQRFLHELNERDLLEHTFSGASGVADALTAAAIATVAETTAEFAASVVAERTLAATAHGVPLFYRAVRGLEEPNETLFAGHTPKANAYPNFKAIVVTNIEPKETADWLELREATLHVDTDWNVNLQKISF